MKKRIVILGGGFGGLYTALEIERTIARDPNVEVTLVNHDNFFLFTPMLHEVAASDLDMTHIVNPIRKLLKRVQFFQGDVERISLEKKVVEVSHGSDYHHHELEYDQLVVQHHTVDSGARCSLGLEPAYSRRRHLHSPH